MLDMGFLSAGPAHRRAVSKGPPDDVLLGHLPPEIEGMTKWVLRDPGGDRDRPPEHPAETITHAIYPVAKDQKFDLLLALLDGRTMKAASFSRARRSSRTKLRTAQGSKALGGGNPLQPQPDRACRGAGGLQVGQIRVLVATDIAARGLDVAGVSHVINYDVPQHPEDYVHRIGRTGRAQNVGDAFTIFTAEEVDHVRAIERFIGRAIPRLKLENFPYVYTALFNEDQIAPGGVGRGCARTADTLSVPVGRNRGRSTETVGTSSLGSSWDALAVALAGRAAPL
jgi:ATP-dependent RNA helicase RhlE